MRNYKSDKIRVEDALIPCVLEALMLSHLEQVSIESDSYDKAFELLRPDIATEVKEPKVMRRLNKLKDKVITFFTDQKCEVRKAYMIISALASTLHEKEAVSLGEGTKEVIIDIDDIIMQHYDDEDIKRQDESAMKQVPKLLKVIQQEGYFI